MAKRATPSAGGGGGMAYQRPEDRDGQLYHVVEEDGPYGKISVISAVNPVNPNAIDLADEISEISLVNPVNPNAIDLADVPKHTALEDPDLRGRMIAFAERQIDFWMHCNAHFEELSPLVDAIRKAQAVMRGGKKASKSRKKT